PSVSAGDCGFLLSPCGDPASGDHYLTLNTTGPDFTAGNTPQSFFVFLFPLPPFRLPAPVRVEKSNSLWRRITETDKLPNPTAVMDEMDLPQMKKEVESLKYQLAFKREKSSKTVTDLVKWIEDGVPEDPFLNPELMKNNPWVEKGKCILL
uniref:Guanine nucleotide binding protein (G protein), gamma 13b n=1 Tax=Hippocampus comes TaxID=109280 RepID=A0A3Q2YDX0_HIPCM